MLKNPVTPDVIIIILITISGAFCFNIQVTLLSKEVSKTRKKSMINQRVTLQDIAQLADVTKMTVSRFLRTPEKVSPETRERITKVMEEVGYPLEEARGTEPHRLRPHAESR